MRRTFIFISAIAALTLVAAPAMSQSKKATTSQHEKASSKKATREKAQVKKSLSATQTKNLESARTRLGSDIKKLAPDSMTIPRVDAAIASSRAFETKIAGLIGEDALIGEDGKRARAANKAILSNLTSLKGALAAGDAKKAAALQKKISAQIASFDQNMAKVLD